MLQQQRQRDDETHQDQQHDEIRLTQQIAGHEKAASNGFAYQIVMTQQG